MVKRFYKEGETPSIGYIYDLCGSSKTSYQREVSAGKVEYIGEGFLKPKLDEEGDTVDLTPRQKKLTHFFKWV